MAREKGTSIFPATYEVQATSALDPRIVVHKKSDLININTWPTNGKDIKDPALIVFIYNGMEVTVLNDIEADTDLPQGHTAPTYNPISYRLIDNTKWNSYDGWQRLNTGKNGIFDSLSVGNLFTINSNGATFNTKVTFNGETTHNSGIKTKGIESTGHILPKTDNMYNIGSLNKSWSNIYAYNEVLHNNLTVLGGSIYSAPNDDGTTREIIHASSSRFDLGKGFIDKVLWIHANELKYNTKIMNNNTKKLEDVQVFMISTNGSIGIGNVGGAPAEKLHVADGYVIANGYKMWTGNSTGTHINDGYAVLTNGKCIKLFSSETLNNSIRYKGNFNFNFKGDNNSKTDTLTGTTSVSKSNHTHSISIPSSFTSTFTGKADATNDTTLSISYSATTLDLSITTTHNHAYQPKGDISTTIAGNTAKNTGEPSANVDVASSGHTHTLTPYGSIDCYFNDGPFL